MKWNPWQGAQMPAAQQRTLQVFLCACLAACSGQNAMRRCPWRGAAAHAYKRAAREYRSASLAFNAPTVSQRRLPRRKATFTGSMQQSDGGSVGGLTSFSVGWENFYGRDREVFPLRGRGFLYGNNKAAPVRKEVGRNGYSPATGQQAAGYS